MPRVLAHPSRCDCSRHRVCAYCLGILKTPRQERDIPFEAAAFVRACLDDSQNEPPDFETNDGFDGS